MRSILQHPYLGREGEREGGKEGRNTRVRGIQFLLFCFVLLAYHNCETDGNTTARKLFPLVSLVWNADETSPLEALLHQRRETSRTINQPLHACARRLLEATFSIAMCHRVALKKKKSSSGKYVNHSTCTVRDTNKKCCF